MGDPRLHLTRFGFTDALFPDIPHRQPELES